MLKSLGFHETMYCAIKVKNGEVDYAVTEKGQRIYKTENSKVVIDTLGEETISLYANAECFVNDENTRDEYWLVDNILECANGVKYRVVNNRHGELITAENENSMVDAYKFCWNKNFTYGMNNQWDIIKVYNQDNEIVWKRE